MQNPMFLAAFLVLTIGGSAYAEPANLVNPGKLTYGTAATFAPFEYMDGGKYVGVDIEMIELLAAKMGLKTEMMAMEFKGLIPALQSKRIDIINSAMYINEERKAAVDFVPYLRITQQIVVQKGNPAKIAGRDDLCGKKVAVTLGGIQEFYARADDKKCKETGKAAVEIMTFPSAQDSALSVMQKRVDAFYNSTPGAMQQVAERPDAYEIAGEPFAGDTLIGIAVVKDRPDLKTALQEAVTAIRADGNLGKIVAKYKLPPSMLDPL